ncbi:protein kinase domain-containing protein [Pyxidicoccus sp. MSG2]|uniref:serine/threonine-protein kinase n=1 Tax=Pyxidicoccus sp. MSG2 TaxID=2996790 RepID=UPI003B63ECDB
MDLQPGDRFGRYELVSWLGRGGMAETWRARLVGDAGVTKPVLIKKVLPEFAGDEAFISMFISEARISATLSHGNVAQVFDFGKVDGDYFLAMEFVDGQPLHRILTRAAKTGLRALPIPLATFIALEMCRGLHYAHTRADEKGVPLGIVHRDISPDNVLISYESQVKIVDFGIAKARSLRNFFTEPGVVKGKYLFFSPEQARGEDVDARTDVWATGVVLYELLCGQLPVSGEQYTQLTAMTRLSTGEFPSPRQVRKDLPEELDEIVMRALSVNLDMRFESSHAFGDALASFLNRFAPRFSSMNVAYLVRELFRKELANDGRQLAVPPAFLEELAVWRTNDALVPAPPSNSGAVTVVRPMRRKATADAAAPEPAVAPGRSSRVSLATMGIGAGAVLALGAAALFLTSSPKAVSKDLSPLQPLGGPGMTASPTPGAPMGDALRAGLGGQGGPGSEEGETRVPTNGALLPASSAALLADSGVAESPEAAARAPGTEASSVDGGIDSLSEQALALAPSGATDAGIDGALVPEVVAPSSIWLDAKRHVIVLNRKLVAFPGLSAGRTYRVAELSDVPPPEPESVKAPTPSNQPPLLFLLLGSSVVGETTLGEVTRDGQDFQGASAISFFTLGSPPRGRTPQRTLQLSSVQVGPAKRLVFHPESKVASVDRAALIEGLNRWDAYSLTLTSAGTGAFIHGLSRGPARRVACVQWRPSTPAGVPAEGWPVAFLVERDREVRVEGVEALRCGFVDDDPSDNQGRAELQIRRAGRAKGDWPPSSEPEELARNTSRAIRERDYVKATQLARQCLDLEPLHASCLLHLATAQTRLGYNEPAAENYRLFVQHHPDDRRVDRVRKLLAEHDAQKQTPRTGQP